MTPIAETCAPMAVRKSSIVSLCLKYRMLLPARLVSLPESQILRAGLTPRRCLEVRRSKLQMIALGRVGHGSARKERTPEKGQLLRLLFEQAKVHVQRDFAVRPHIERP